MQLFSWTLYAFTRGPPQVASWKYTPDLGTSRSLAAPSLTLQHRHTQLRVLPQSLVMFLHLTTGHWLFDTFIIWREDLFFLLSRFVRIADQRRNSKEGKQLCFIWPAPVRIPAPLRPRGSHLLPYPGCDIRSNMRVVPSEERPPSRETGRSKDHRLGIDSCFNTSKSGDAHLGVTKLPWAQLHASGMPLGPIRCCGFYKTGLCKEHQRWQASTWSQERSTEQILRHRLRRTQPCGHFDLRLLASKTLRPYISVV